jgi:protease I
MSRSVLIPLPSTDFDPTECAIPWQILRQNKDIEVVFATPDGQKANGVSILKDRRTTGLLRTQEMLAWQLTRFWMGRYYRTYPESLQSEVMRNLVSRELFLKGPPPLFRDHPKNLDRGFVVRDENYISARWPGDAHRFAVEFLKVLSF